MKKLFLHFSKKHLYFLLDTVSWIMSSWFWSSNYFISSNESGFLNLSFPIYPYDCSLKWGLIRVTMHFWLWYYLSYSTSRLFTKVIFDSKKTSILNSMLMRIFSFTYDLKDNKKKAIPFDRKAPDRSAGQQFRTLAF